MGLREMLEWLWEAMFLMIWERHGCAWVGYAGSGISPGRAMRRIAGQRGEVG